VTNRKCLGCNNMKTHGVHWTRLALTHVSESSLFNHPHDVQQPQTVCQYILPLFLATKVMMFTVQGETATAFVRNSEELEQPVNQEQEGILWLLVFDLSCYRYANGERDGPFGRADRSAKKMNDVQEQQSNCQDSPIRNLVFYPSIHSNAPRHFPRSSLSIHQAHTATPYQAPPQLSALPTTLHIILPRIFPNSLPLPADFAIQVRPGNSLLTPRVRPFGGCSE